MSRPLWIRGARPYGLDVEVAWGVDVGEAGGRAESFVAWTKPRPLFAAVLAVSDASVALLASRRDRWALMADEELADEREERARDAAARQAYEAERLRGSR